MFKPLITSHSAELSCTLYKTLEKMGYFLTKDEAEAILSTVEAATANLAIEMFDTFTENLHGKN